MLNLINGKYVNASNGSAIEIKNPARNQLIATVPNSTIDDVNDCVKAAVSASKKWAEVPLHKRCSIIYKFLDLVDEEQEVLAATLCRETGKPITEARKEVSNTRTIVSSYIEHAKHLYGINVPIGSEPGHENTMQFTIRQPLGVVACIIPSNFPCDLFAQKVPSALLMGNAVIVKPSTSNPLTVHKYCVLLQKAGIPDGVINCISGDGPIVGQALAHNKDVNLITLAGSTIVGKQIMESASSNLTHVMLELGANDAFIVDKDGDVDLAVNEAIKGRLYNAGQLCCASKRFLVHNSIKDEFINKLLNKLNNIVIGDPLYVGTELGCLISEKAAKLVEEQVKATLAQGAILAFGGRRNNAFFEPTILVNIKRDMDIMKDMEVFGPVLPIMGFDSIDEAIDVANQTSYGLCGNVITKDMNNALKIASKLEVAGVIINGSSNHRSSEMSFGGWKNFGMGSEGITSTLKQMSREKTIVLKDVLQ